MLSFVLFALTIATADSSKVTGTWDGTYTNPHGSRDEMTVIASKDSAWHVVVVLSAGGSLIPSSAANARVDGNDVYWDLDAMGMSCRAAATVAGETLNGEFRCVGATMRFSLQRR